MRSLWENMIIEGTLGGHQGAASGRGYAYLTDVVVIPLSFSYKKIKQLS